MKKEKERKEKERKIKERRGKGRKEGRKEGRNGVEGGRGEEGGRMTRKKERKEGEGRKNRTTRRSLVSFGNRSINMIIYLKREFKELLASPQFFHFKFHSFNWHGRQLTE